MRKTILKTGWRFLKRYTMIASVRYMDAGETDHIATELTMLEIERRGRVRRLNKNVLLIGVLVALLVLVIVLWLLKKN